MRVKCDGCDRVDHAHRRDLTGRGWTAVVLDHGTTEVRERLYCGRCADEVLSAHRFTARRISWRKAETFAA